ncbi:sensor domain-containing protein [Streptacidiphilus sp. NEAU-YB345]|uniref:histidine kinase n=1 Tax=Streptacidiphilus fuscans TaxID=2789292 RepID=A0A931FFP0_9ACTN|nr:sensor domain-containing protein [Streptacidiphilus fuscans]
MIWGFSWATGGGGRAAGAVLLLPGVLTVAAVTCYKGGPPGGHHGVVWAAVLLLPLGVLSSRWVASEHRRLVARWSGTPIASPYREFPDGASPVEQWRGRLVGWLGDPASWRDLAWVVLSAALVLAGGVVLVAAPLLLNHLGPNGRFTDKPVLLFGVELWLSPLLVLWGAPVLLRLHDNAARALLGPSRQRELVQRVDHLSRTRADTIDHGATELRRIERDLHDGAQARLVALGMALNAAEQLFDTDPEAARAMLAEARSSSARALGELRDLVRGIHPPVLADRGLADAVEALAFDLPLPVEVSGGLPQRVPAAVESAAYFAVSELLANVTKHAEARRIWVEIGHTGEVLRISVTDDGRGGVDPSKGTGLRGVERRLAAFDGLLAVSSPVGGPTIASLEIPCALLSPKTSSSSGTA